MTGHGGTETQCLSKILCAFASLWFVGGNRGESFIDSEACALRRFGKPVVSRASTLRPESAPALSRDGCFVCGFVLRQLRGDGPLIHVDPTRELRAIDDDDAIGA